MKVRVACTALRTGWSLRMGWNSPRGFCGRDRLQATAA